MGSGGWKSAGARGCARARPALARRDKQRGPAIVRCGACGRELILLWSTLLAALCAILLFPVSALTDENQGWQTDETHIHSNFGLTMFQNISSRITVPVTTLLHNSRSTVTGVRWSCESDVKQAIPTNFRGTGVTEETFTVNLTVDPSLCPKGWQEIRVTSDATLPDGSREFTTSRECVNITTGNARRRITAAVRVWPGAVAVGPGMRPRRI
jgi:hypothetical protein